MPSSFFSPLTYTLQSTLLLLLILLLIHIPPTHSLIPIPTPIPIQEPILAQDISPNPPSPENPIPIHLAPRWYETNGIPATPASEPISPNPRYLVNNRNGHNRNIFNFNFHFNDNADVNPGLHARQANSCASGSHSCEEVGAKDLCCADDRYCYLDRSWAPRCCALGVRCPDSACAADLLFCNRTVTRTVSFSDSAGITTIESGSGDGGSKTGTETEAPTLGIETYSQFSACCNRACDASSYSCGRDFGGQCCPNGFRCISGSRCVGVAGQPTATSKSISSFVSEVPVGCTTSQITCAQSDGGGCCGIGSVCTFQDVAGPTAVVSGDATVTATATGSGTGSLRIAVCAPDPANDGADGASSDGNLSKDAVVGIAVGISLGAVIVIASVTWVCVRRRGGGGGGTRSGASAHEMRRAGTVYRHGGGGLGTEGDEEDEFGHESMRPGPTLARWSSRSVTTWRRSFGRGWYGSDRNSVPGPTPSTEYGDDGGQQGVHDPYAAITPLSGRVSRNTTRGSGRPFGPDDIVRAVEIGDNEEGGGGARGGEGPTEKDNAQLLRIDETPGLEDNPEPRVFELVGSMPTSPSENDEAYNPMDRDRVSPYQPEPGRK